jgi:hypothetical protein
MKAQAGPQANDVSSAAQRSSASQADAVRPALRFHDECPVPLVPTLTGPLGRYRSRTPSAQNVVRRGPSSRIRAHPAHLARAVLVLVSDCADDTTDPGCDPVCGPACDPADQIDHGRHSESSCRDPADHRGILDRPVHDRYRSRDTIHPFQEEGQNTPILLKEARPENCDERG